MTHERATETLQQFLVDNIPLARATGARISGYNAQGLSVNAPLVANSNHHGTAFGGSLYVVALAAGWGLTHLLLQEAGVDASLFVSHAQADYLRPVTGDLYATAARPSAATLKDFISTLNATGRAQLRIEISMDCMDKPAFELRADFAARLHNKP